MHEFYENEKRYGPSPSILSEDKEGIEETAVRRHLKLRERAYRKFISDFNNPAIPAEIKALMFHESDQPFLIPQSLMFEGLGIVVYVRSLLMALRHFLHDHPGVDIFDFENGFFVIKKHVAMGKYEEISRLPIRNVRLSLEIRNTGGRSNPIIHAKYDKDC
jgi:hypothetical protein